MLHLGLALVAGVALAAAPAAAFGTRCGRHPAAAAAAARRFPNATDMPNNLKVLRHADSHTVHAYVAAASAAAIVPVY
jgi:hypothetical protein